MDLNGSVTAFFCDDWPLRHRGWGWGNSVKRHKTCFDWFGLISGLIIWLIRQLNVLFASKTVLSFSVAYWDAKFGIYYAFQMESICRQKKLRRQAAKFFVDPCLYQSISEKHNFRFQVAMVTKPHK